MKYKTLIISGLIASIHALTASAANDVQQAVTPATTPTYTANKDSVKQPYLTLASNNYYSSFQVNGAMACGDNECREGERCCEEDGFNWCVPVDETCE